MFVFAGVTPEDITDAARETFIRENAGKAFEFMVEKVDEDRAAQGLNTVAECKCVSQPMHDLVCQPISPKPSVRVRRPIQTRPSFLCTLCDGLDASRIVASASLCQAERRLKPFLASGVHCLVDSEGSPFA